jgi:hypothetical protein
VSGCAPSSVKEIKNACEGISNGKS